MTNPNDYRTKLDRVTAEQVAQILDSGAAAWMRVPVAKVVRPVARAGVERDVMEAMPAGHPTSWNALWQRAAPPFPGLTPMGARDAVLVSI